MLLFAVKRKKKKIHLIDVNAAGVVYPVLADYDAVVHVALTGFAVVDVVLLLLMVPELIGNFVDFLIVGIRLCWFYLQ